MSLVAIYSLFSIGILKATHFCMGREASVAFFSAEADKCFCSKFMNEENTCCDDEHEVIRLEDEQKSITVFSLSVPQWFVLEKLYTVRLIALQKLPVERSVFDLSHFPPPKIPLFKTHCSYVFYDEELVG